MELKDMQGTMLELFDEVHDAIHMLRQMSAIYVEKAEDLESTLAAALRLELVDLAEMETIPDNVIPFPTGVGGYSDDTL
jgi:hypothetical protein